LRILNTLGLRGVKPVISGSHKGIKAAVTKVLKATAVCHLLSYAEKSHRRMLSVAI
jgi:putative transposase